ncbi:MAG TPA: AI-2E family transporter [Candidatus Vogelbacteria bacterium]|nr:AI-2E family transporter [Candidatus Vogelbacteria bacterium]
MERGKKKTNKNIAFYIVLGILTIALILMFRPFFQVLILAGVLAIIFQPLHLHLLKYSNNRKNIAALISSILIILAAIIPLILFINVLTIEIKDAIFNYLRTDNLTSSVEVVWNRLALTLDNIIPGEQKIADLKGSELTESLKNLINFESLGFFLSDNINIFKPKILTDAVGNLIKILVNIFVFILTLFYFNRDQEKIKEIFILLSPLEKENSILLIEKFKQTVMAVIVGSLFIAIIQGFLTGLGFNILNLPQPIFWGFIAGITSIIPSVGPALIMVPAAGILLWIGSIPGAIFILFWCFAIVGPVDYYLRPLIVGQKIKIHSLLVLLSVLGGIAFWGVSGFIVGPVILSACLALINIHILKD